MNKRDVLIFFGIFFEVILWGIYILLVLPNKAETVSSAEIIANFGCSLLALLLYMGIIVIASIVFPKFGKWGDKKIWKSRKK